MQPRRATGVVAMPGSAFPGLVSGANKVRVFVSYDYEHDQDLLNQLTEQAAQATSGFEISGQSKRRAPTDLWNEPLRRSIREVDQVIVICGEHTDHADHMGPELRIAQEEKRPYSLLWGRREPMCTKPASARAVDSMFSWTPEILQNQIFTLRRLAESDKRMAERAQARALPSG